MKYFAYGSNMDKDRMTERKINFTSRQFAKLAGYRLVFNKKAKDGDYTYANLIASDNDFVEGILYEFPDNEISILDKVEGFPSHYDKVQVAITDKNDNSIIATTYIAQADKIVNGFSPTREYLNYLLAGKDILSAPYYETLKQVQTNESK